MPDYFRSLFLLVFCQVLFNRSVYLFLFGNLRSNKNGEDIINIVLDSLSETIEKDKYSMKRDFFIKKHYEKN